ncbi:FlaG protein [Succinivibrio dextrinosolvens]|uniref:flagellar protein FlaG n=1 Tax=Succinivibrio dextrinosolvens TaxID=83771 RepID=UPI0008F34D02|nr:flagellar protein FlaG [Succinivibrio dextrinosolvens]SFS46883.1 FlaG protein [Succinivibrio dextrinosolvens]
MSDISIKDAISSLFGISRTAFKDVENTVNNEEEKKVFKSGDSKETKDRFGQVSSLQDDDQKSSESLSERSKDKVEENKEISKALQERNEKLAQERMYALNQQNIGLSFSFDDSDNTLIKVTDMNTKKLVRQIPSEEFLEFAEKLDKMIEENQSSLSLDKDEIKGLLLDDKA